MIHDQMKCTLFIPGLMLLFQACGDSPKQPTSIRSIALEAMAQQPFTCECYSTSALNAITITFNDQVPGDLQSFGNQSEADCFAWQQFVTLNWPVTDGASFGEPGDKSFVQWETFMPKDVMFQKNGVAPPAWGTLVSPHYTRKFGDLALLRNKKSTKLLTFTSKVSGGDTLQDLDIHQAFPQNKPNWLGAQNETNVWYEIMLNKDYYDFVVSRGYYNAAVQHDSAKAGIPLNFPKGEYGGAVGAIELKAAWMEVKNESLPKWKRYKLSRAVVLDPFSDTLREATVALVGLHILHKTTNQPTWVWATFEQVDNVPGGETPPAGYNFYNPDCQPRNVALSGGGSATVRCSSNVAPPYYLNKANPVPLQVTRTNPIDAVDAEPVNKRMQENIRKFYPNSVWQYYELVDVIWSQRIQPDPKKPIEAPRNISTSSMTSGAHIVANTTLETYVQDQFTCYNCHVFSHIAHYPPDSANNNIFGDFSFAIKFAQYDPASVKRVKKYIEEQ